MAATAAPTAATLATRMVCWMRGVGARLHVAIDNHPNGFFPSQDVANGRFANVIFVVRVIGIAERCQVVIVVLVIVIGHSRS
jgi:hypothetical protein